MAHTNRKVIARKKRIKRIRKKLSGTAECPRMRVFRSNRHMYVQIIDDIKQVTLVAASTEDKSFDASGSKDKSEQAFNVGKIIAKQAKDAGIEQVVFDRGGNKYHGRVKAVSEGARKAGLKL